MATTFKVCVQKRRKDGFSAVYIRVIHNSRTAYIPTGKMVADAHLTAHGEVTDPFILQQCSTRVIEYMDALNRRDTTAWTVHEVVDFLRSGSADICFSDYARKHHDRMVDRGQERNARNYELAYQHLERFAGTNKVMFSQLTSAFVQRWIDSLGQTHRAKEMYPVCVRQIFKAAQMEYNDYDNGIIKIRTNPWAKVQIPHSDRTEHLAITPQAARAFFAAPVPESRYKYPLPELGRDVAMLILCLGGINTVDLYNLRKADCRDGVICYKRAKTRHARADEAYFEMRVPPIVRPLFDKYRSAPADEFLLDFHTRHTTSDSFCANVNTGIRQMCESLGLPRPQWYSAYTFRHTWATIAQNDCGATIEEVAFGLNHSRGHRVTRGYIRIDFTPAWELNEKVVELVFFTEKVSRREEERQRDAAFSRFSPKHLMRAACYFRGRRLAEVEDIGFHNVDEIIARLSALLPSDIPTRSMLQFRIENRDKCQTAIYERMKRP